MTFNNFKIIIKDDFISYYHNRNKKNPNLLDVVIEYVKNWGFRYTFYLRLCSFLKGKKKLIILYFISRLIYKNLSIKYGIQIPYYTDIKGGFHISHYSCIVIHGKSKIGKNLNIRQGVTIGNTNKGVPIIGDNVDIGAGASIIGKVTIGDNVIIGANSVITKDIPNNCTVVGCNKIVHDKINTQ